jgi:hypothetical protein
MADEELEHQLQRAQDRIRMLQSHLTKHVTATTRLVETTENGVVAAALFDFKAKVLS